MGLVFFDFDCTLTRRDTIWPLCRFLGGERRARLGYVAATMLLAKLRLSSNHRLKIAICETLLQGESERRIEELARRFASECVEGMLNPRVRAAMFGHRDRGDEVFLVSSNFSFVLRAVSEPWKIAGVFGTEAEVADGRFTGRIDGRTCDGDEKLTRVVRAFGAERVRDATAYGDSRGDGPLLAFVRHPVWVSPDSPA